MTLRRRLILGLLALLTVFVVGAIVTVVLQRGHLLDQIDDQLESTPLPGLDPAGRSGVAQDPEREQPFSSLYVVQIEPDQTVTTVISGQRLVDTPDLTGLVSNPPAGPGLLTVDGVQGESTFRVRYIPAAGGREITIAALPLDEISATVRQLIYTLAAVAALLAAVTVLLASWVGRYGLRPISEMTATADAIAAGDTTTRAGSYGQTTEAGRLANALNVMLDERDESDATLRSFVSNASHELRTPLTSIRGYLDLYEQGAFREPGQLDDVVRRMRIESARMNLLVEDLLLLAKLDEEQPLEMEQVDVHLLLGDVAASARAANPERSISIETQGTAELVIEADKLRIHQAVASLVDNAVIHTDAPIGLDARIVDDVVEIVVDDQGPGLAAADAAHVFDRFYRSDDSRSRLSGGSGLGLSIVKSVVEAHGGSVRVETEVGQGARFIIRLPITKASQT